MLKTAGVERLNFPAKVDADIRTQSFILIRKQVYIFSNIESTNPSMKKSKGFFQ